MQNKLEDQTGDTYYLGRLIPFPVYDKKNNVAAKDLPAILYSREPEIIYKAFTDIFQDIIKALLKHDDLKTEWISYYDVDESNILFPLTKLDCHETLDKFTTFMGTEIYETFKSSNQKYTVKLKIKNINMPFQFIQIFHVILAAAISKNHFMSIQAYLEKMDSTNLLSLPKFLSIVSIADDLANNPTILRKNTPNIKRARKIYHSMLLLSIFEGYATHGPFPFFPTHWCYKIKMVPKLYSDLCNYDESYFIQSRASAKPDEDDEKIYNSIYNFYDQQSNEDDNDEDEDEDEENQKKITATSDRPKDWTCTTDIFLHYYVNYIKDITSKSWFKGVNNLTSTFTKPLTKSTKVKTCDFDLQPTLHLFNKTKNEHKKVPFSFKNVISTLFEKFPDTTNLPENITREQLFQETCFWKIDNLKAIDRWFGLKEMNTNEEEEDSEPDPIEYTKCQDLYEFKKLAIKEYQLPTTKNIRKKEIAKYYFLLDQKLNGNFNWSNAQHILSQLQTPIETQNFDYISCKSFKEFQMQAFVHYNLPSTSHSMQASISTAYMAIDCGTNLLKMSFEAEEAQHILKTLTSVDQSTGIFQLYRETTFADLLRQIVGQKR
jgi:hypothetical protein